MRSSNRSVLVVATIATVVIGCAKGGGSGDDPKPDAASVDAPRQLDAPITVDAAVTVDAAITVDAAVTVDGGTGLFCTTNAGCTVSGECCVTLGGPMGFCAPGTISPIGGACIPL